MAVQPSRGMRDTRDLSMITDAIVASRLPRGEIDKFWVGIYSPVSQVTQSTLRYYVGEYQFLTTKNYLPLCRLARSTSEDLNAKHKLHVAYIPVFWCIVKCLP